MPDPEQPLRRATDHKFKKRYLVIPVILLVVTVIGFLALKTSEKRIVPTTETKATASVDVPTSPATAPAPQIAVDLNKAASPPSKVFRDAIETTTTIATTETTDKGTHFQLSLDVLKERENFKAQQQRWYAQTLFSVIVGLASVYVILSKKYPDDCNKWAYSTIAFIMGFWLKGL